MKTFLQYIEEEAPLTSPRPHTRSKAAETKAKIRDTAAAGVLGSAAVAAALGPGRKKPSSSSSSTPKAPKTPPASNDVPDTARETKIKADAKAAREAGRTRASEIAKDVKRGTKNTAKGRPAAYGTKAYKAATAEGEALTKTPKTAKPTVAKIKPTVVTKPLAKAAPAAAAVTAKSVASNVAKKSALKTAGKVLSGVSRVAGPVGAGVTAAMAFRAMQKIPKAERAGVGNSFMAKVKSRVTGKGDVAGGGRSHYKGEVGMATSGSPNGTSKHELRKAQGK